MKRPLVLVHGIWNQPRVFDHLINHGLEDNLPIFAPFLQHDFGRICLRTLAQKLDKEIQDHWGREVEVDLLGFSMGGVISRIWLQEMDGASRTNHFVSVGCPHQGTYTACLLPGYIFKGVSQMRHGSDLIRELNSDISTLRPVKCSSYFCYFDLMVFPGWKAVLPIGSHHSLPVMTHAQLISHPQALEILVKAINNF